MDASTSDFNYSLFMGVSIGRSSPGEWVKQVEKKYNTVDWTKLTVTQRKDSLYYLYDSEDKDRFEEAVQYVIKGYPLSPIEDLKGDVSLLTVLSTPLAVTVVRFHCSDTFSLKHAPGLMQKGICPQKLEKILKASQERLARRGDYASTDPSVEPAEESNVGGETLGTIRGDDEVDGIEEPQPYELDVKRVREEAPGL